MTENQPQVQSDADFSRLPRQLRVESGQQVKPLALFWISISPAQSSFLTRNDTFTGPLGRGWVPVFCLKRFRKARRQHARSLVQLPAYCTRHDPGLWRSLLGMEPMCAVLLWRFQQWLIIVPIQINWRKGKPGGGVTRNEIRAQRTMLSPPPTTTRKWLGSFVKRGIRVFKEQLALEKGVRWAVETAPWVKRLLDEHEGLSLDPWNPHKSQVWRCVPGILGLGRLASWIWELQALRKTLSQNTRRKAIEVDFWPPYG